MVDKLSEEDCSPESIGIYISIYILSVWFDGILLQVNVIFVENPRVNSNGNVEIVEIILCWLTIRNLSTYVEDIINVEAIDAVTLDNAIDVIVLDNMLVVCLTSLEYFNVVMLTELC